ncbi:MAG: hypothetical protein MUC63_06405 [Planctomycetes bacterium]|jgi:hypothetical protein|nr:hypothetical protein [Planctomycetota bacterium]
MAKAVKIPDELQLLTGDRGNESTMHAYVESPTWIVDEAWERVREVGMNSLDAYLQYCEHLGLPHSYLLGLDILITGTAADKGQRVVDIRPTILEGPCCNSYPACPNIWASRLYKQLELLGLDPGRITYPTDPGKILDKIVATFRDVFEARGGSGDPKVGIFTRPYPESEEEAAHNLALNAFKAAGIEAYRVTPDENPEVKKGKLWVNGVPLDMCYRRIERIHVPIFYGLKLGEKIINETKDTLFINPWSVDDLRSKTKEEACFRMWEKKTGKVISRPLTLMGKEISGSSVRELSQGGGYALKKWNSTGGKGVFLHMVKSNLGELPDKLYARYDGRHMAVLSDADFEKELKGFDSFTEDASIQQLRLIDARPLTEGRLVYDTRVNVLYNEKKKEWEVLSGISRVVKCGPKVENGNSLLTNVSSGAEIAPLIIGKMKPKTKKDKMTFGPLLSAMLKGKTEIEAKDIK